MKNNMKKVLSLLLAALMMASLSVTAFAVEIPETEGDNLKGTNDFYYTITKEDVYADISGVKLSWSVPVVKYTKTDTRTWDTTSLKWVQTNPVSTEGTDVSFTLTNRGSYAVKANVSFTPVIADSASVDFGSTNDPTLATIVKDDHTLQVAQGNMSDDDYATAKSKYITDNCSATISGTVSLAADKLTAASGKLGTYTVSIRNTKHTVTVVCQTATGGDSYTNYTVNDGATITVNGSELTINGETVSSGTTGWAYNAVTFTKIENGDITVNTDLTLYRYIEPK